MRVLRAGLLLGYPLLVYFALQHVSARVLSLGLLAILAARLATGRAPARGSSCARRRGRRWRSASRSRPPRSGTIRSRSCSRPPPELGAARRVRGIAVARGVGGGVVRARAARIARRRRAPLLPARDAALCSFFAANGAIAFGLAVFGSARAWTLYTGFLAYLGVGALFAAEYSYRQWRFRRYLGAPSDVLFRRLFPPRAE
jgi:hypothetical protein